MLNQTQAGRLFNLNVAFKNPLQNKLFSMMKGPIEHVLDFPRLNRFYDGVSRLHDGLIIVDLTKTEPRMLERYLGKDGTRMFLAHHEAVRQERHAACA
jgi:hypothetical protein